MARSQPRRYKRCVLKTPIGRLRLIGMLEGASFVALLAIAMPMKYMAGNPLGVKVLGPAHGLLFVAYCFLIAETTSARSWPWTRGAGLLLASLLPFGPFVVDGRLKREQADAPSAESGERA